METLSHRFLEALWAPRDSIYARALAASASPAAAETALLQAVRSVLAKTTSDAYLDVAGAVVSQFPVEAAIPTAGPAPGVHMPADLWARIAAMVQWEAARAGDALPADSTLLKPDPILAPKRHKPRVSGGHFDTRSPGRLMLVVLLAVGVGALLTLYLLIR